MDTAAFLRHHAPLLLPSLLSKQTAARVVITEHSQSTSLHEVQGQEEYLQAKEMLRASQQELKDYATKSGTCYVASGIHVASHPIRDACHIALGKDWST